MNEAKFWTWVIKEPGPDGCWLWQGARDVDGYGLLRSGRPMRRAHRFAYEAVIGPIPKGLQLDHLCRVRNCVNPAHLEPVTGRENLRREAAARPARTTCKHGHLLTEENTYLHNGVRSCRTCRRQHERDRRSRPPKPPELGHWACAHQVRGGFCYGHWSWKCSVGQGRCQTEGRCPISGTHPDLRHVRIVPANSVPFDQEAQ